MDVRQLLLLANDNSALAKKKAARLDCDSDDDEPGISNDAVAAFLVKQKKFKQKLKDQEAESKRKRVRARLNASLKTTKVEKQIKEMEEAESGRFLPGDMRIEKAKRSKEKLLKQQEKEREEKQKADELKEKRRKKHEEKQLEDEKRREEEEEIKRVEREKAERNRKRKSMSPEESMPVRKKEKKSKKDKEKIVKESRDNMHRTEKKHKSKEVFESSLTCSSRAEKEKNMKTMKEKNNKKASSGAPSLSFSDLMKLAKTNVATARLNEDGTLFKKKEKPKTFDEEHGYVVKQKEKTKDLSEEKNTQKSKSRDEYNEPPSKPKDVNGKIKSGKVVNDIDCKDKKKDKLHNGFSEKHESKKSEKEISKLNENKCNNNNETSKIEKNREFNKIDKTKMDKLQDSSTHSNKHKDNEHRKQSKHKHDVHEKTSKIKDSAKGDSAKENKYSSNSPPPVKRGLIAQTISTKKSGNIQPPSKITNTFKQVKPHKLSGIEAQCVRGGFGKEENTKMKMKKVGRKNDGNNEDALDKEMRMLAKKRKLFEMRGTTANVDPDEDMYDSEEEYDLSEEDDDDDEFIDDTEAAADVSKAIRRITGYDRRQFDDSDEDINNMESNFSQIQQEEARSARIAKEEDRIEALKEAEELARENAKRIQKETQKKKKR